MRYTAKKLINKLKTHYGIHNDSKTDDFYTLHDPRADVYCQVPDAAGKELREDTIEHILKTFGIDRQDFDSHI